MPIFLAHCWVISMISWLFSNDISSYLSLNRFSLVARFSAREWIVKLSGCRFSTFCSVCATSSFPSPGRPMIRSILILSNPSSLAIWKILTVSSTVCFLPITSSVFWFIVCGLTEILVTGNSFITCSFSLVMLSGRPASTVYSLTQVKSKVV